MLTWHFAWKILSALFSVQWHCVFGKMTSFTTPSTKAGTRSPLAQSEWLRWCSGGGWVVAQSWEMNPEVPVSQIQFHMRWGSMWGCPILCEFIEKRWQNLSTWVAFLWPQCIWCTTHLVVHSMINFHSLSPTKSLHLIFPIRSALLAQFLIVISFPMNHWLQQTVWKVFSMSPFDNDNWESTVTNGAETNHQQEQKQNTLCFSSICAVLQLEMHFEMITFVVSHADECWVLVWRQTDWQTKSHYPSSLWRIGSFVSGIKVSLSRCFVPNSNPSQSKRPASLNLTIHSFFHSFSTNKSQPQWISRKTNS